MHASKGLTPWQLAIVRAWPSPRPEKSSSTRSRTRIMDVLVDLESLTEWSSAHQKVEVLERDEHGRPSTHGKS